MRIVPAKVADAEAEPDRYNDAGRRAANSRPMTNLLEQADGTAY